MPVRHDNPAKHGPAAQIGTVRGSAVCVYCRRQPVDPRFSPFCGERCRLQDLARWVDGEYRLAGEAISPEDAPPADTEDDR